MVKEGAYHSKFAGSHSEQEARQKAIRRIYKKSRSRRSRGRIVENLKGGKKKNSLGGSLNGKLNVSE